MGSTSMQGEYALYINGRFITGGGRLTEPVFDPATSEALGQLPHATNDDLDVAALLDILARSNKEDDKAAARFLASLTVRFITSAAPLKTALERFSPKLRQRSAVINTLYSEQQPDAHATGAPETAA